jgi:FkbM family methyltransferase
MPGNNHDGKSMVEDKFQSQHGEDARLAEHFDWKRAGVYVEIGAFDGKTLSNTWYFEHSLGWTGVLIEANPTQAKACIVNRPQSRVFPVAVVSPEDAGGLVSFEVVDGFEELSSLALQDRYKDYISNANSQGGKQLSVRKIDVATATVDEVLDSAEIDRIDFLTIDIEGHELAALRGMSLQRRWRPQVLLIESTTRVPDPRLAILLFRAGYGYRRTIVINDWYEPTKVLPRAVGLVRQYTKVAPKAMRWLGRRLRTIPPRDSTH